MTDAKCPVCGCMTFYVKDPDDPYESYSFACGDGGVRLDSSVDADEAPEIGAETLTYCDRCAWHGPLKSLTGA